MFVGVSFALGLCCGQYCAVILVEVLSLVTMQCIWYRYSVFYPSQLGVPGHT